MLTFADYSAYVRHYFFQYTNKWYAYKKKYLITPCTYITVPCRDQEEVFITSE